MLNGIVLNGIVRVMLKANISVLQRPGTDSTLMNLIPIQTDFKYSTSNKLVFQFLFHSYYDDFKFK